MKVLWCTNIMLSDSHKSSGNWMYSMLDRISSLYPEIEFAVFSIGIVPEIEEGTFRNFKQLVFPDYKLDSNGLPSAEIMSQIKSHIDDFAPSLIHIWGVEKFWGALSLELNERYKVLLEMQGSKNLCVEPFLGYLPKNIFYRYSGVLELIYPSSFPVIQQRKFYRDGLIEQKVIAQSPYINTQSQFVKKYVKSLNNHAKVFDTNIILRSEIIKATPWSEPSGFSDIQIFSVASPIPYKGVHITIKAFADLKKKIPNARLKIAGIPINSNPIKNSAYVKYILRLIKSLGISDSVSLPGVLSAEEIIEEYKKSKVFVVSSFIETYCLALAEALYVGIPCVASDIDALREFQPKEETELSLLHYAKGNAQDCSQKLEMLIKESALRATLSKNARKNAVLRNNDVTIAVNQYEIYKEIING